MKNLIRSLARCLPSSVKHVAHSLIVKSRVRLTFPTPYSEQFSTRMDWPERDWADRFILIASTPRCGSHYLGHMLGQTGLCGVPLEYLNTSSAKQWMIRFGSYRMETLFPNFVKHRTSPNGTFVLKAHYTGQFAPYKSILHELTRGVGIDKVIWISRRDQLAQAISFLIIHETQA